MSKEYKADSKRLRVIHRPSPASHFVSFTDIFESDSLQPPSRQKPETWSPINPNFYKINENDTDSDDEDSESVAEIKK